MRRIFIDETVKEVAQYYVDHLFERHTRRNFVKPNEGLIAFENEIKADRGTCPLWRNYVDYVDNIRLHFDEIVLLKPSEFGVWHRRYFAILNKQQLTDKNWRGKGNDVSFSDHIVKIMRYKTVRSEDMIPCVKKLGIKTCVYCNAQYTNTVDIEDDGSVKGRYELDHFWPKDEYPFLCISFYNLQPCCGSCNKWKDDEEARFNLYTEDYRSLEPFEFELTPESMVKYMLRQDSEVLDVKLKCNEPGLLDNHLQLFHTEDLYKTFNDELEELVWKYKSFNQAFYEQLIERFSKLFPTHATRNDIIRFLYGFYAKAKDVHKRPLTKVKQDVAKQLGMI